MPLRRTPVHMMHNLTQIVALKYIVQTHTCYPHPVHVYFWACSYVVQAAHDVKYIVQQERVLPTTTPRPATKWHRAPMCVCMCVCVCV